MPQSDRNRWDTRYRERGAGSHEPAPFVAGLGEVLPRTGRAIDVAGGTGRHGLWLARRGWDVTLADVSEVALQMAREVADAEALTLQTLAIDLETEPFPAGPWDLILCSHFLWRPLFGAFTRTLAPNGCVVVVHPTRSNLDRHESPGPQFLLEDGELPTLVRNFETLHYEEGWTEEGRHEARLLARKRD